MSQKKQWSASAKFEISLCAIKGEMTLNTICQRYKVAPSLVHKWKKQLLEQGGHVFENQDKLSNHEVKELKQKQSKLYEKIGQLTVERDVLKKSVGSCLLISDED